MAFTWVVAGGVLRRIIAGGPNPDLHLSRSSESTVDPLINHPILLLIRTLGIVLLLTTPISSLDLSPFRSAFQCPDLAGHAGWD